jgi:hypothetical protein
VSRPGVKHGDAITHSSAYLVCARSAQRGDASREHVSVYRGTAPGSLLTVSSAGLRVRRRCGRRPLRE